MMNKLDERENQEREKNWEIYFLKQYNKIKEKKKKARYRKLFWGDINQERKEEC